jgi:subtilisin family serine protease
MKNLKRTITLLVISVLIFSCTKDEQDIEGIKTNDLSSISKIRNSPDKKYSTNSLIIRYAAGVNENQKQLLRDYHDVTNYKVCPYCVERAIELWIFDDGIAIEPKKTTIVNPPGGMGMDQLISNVDYQFITHAILSNSNIETNFSASAIVEYENYIKENNDGVTIAVFDTGVNPDLPVFSDKFLYNASADGIPGIQSGWDFVNHDDDCFDDNLGVHGTVVTSIITDILNSDQYLIPHQILPLKVCNAEGNSSYFDFLCALNYALPRAEILHMSLGWYDNNSGDLVDNIFLDLVSQYPETIIINSAGNKTNNNDINIHCPSGYTLKNIIAVASCNEFAIQSNPFSPADISDFSNFGQISVDFFAVGESIDFLGYNMSGTSFSAPKVTAMVAKQKYLNPSYMPTQIINYLVTIGIPCQNTFNPNRKVKYSKILNP